VRMISIYNINQSHLNDTLQTIHNVWNVMSTEGDQQNWLLTQQNFDDEACYQLNNDHIWQKQCVKYSSDSLQSQNQCAETTCNFHKIQWKNCTPCTEYETDQHLQKLQKLWREDRNLYNLYWCRYYRNLNRHTISR
jgi:hypothetical protein